MMRLAQGMSNEPNAAGVISTENPQARPQDSIGLFPLYFSLNRTAPASNDRLRL